MPPNRSWHQRRSSWIPAGINLAGIRQPAWLQNITVVLKYLPTGCAHPRSWAGVILG